MESIVWLKHAMTRVPTFVQKQEGTLPGFYRYSLSGDLYDETVNWGLISSVFAAKILSMTEFIDRQATIRIAKRIKTFENPDRTIFDPLLQKKSLIPSFLTSLRTQDIHGLAHYSQMLKRAETRQSWAALLCLGSSPTRPYRNIPETPADIRSFLQSLSWHLPWNAGSHLSHLLFFLHHNHTLFGMYQETYLELVEVVRSFLLYLQSPKDGFWYSGPSVSMTQKINGAMKVLTGLSVIDEKKLPYVEKIIDATLVHPSEEGACCSIDALYVLWACSRYTSYRQTDIERYALHKIDEIKRYYHEDTDGFSFYLHRANQRIYGAKVTRGKDEPDLHGTVLYVWGLVMIASILGLKNVSYRQPIT